jgi:[protein-PII] uridylyltransferase
LGALDRAYSRGHHGLWSARKRAELVDACLVQLYLRTGPPERTALVALGGYGRGELAPHSDLDLLLLHGGSGWTTRWGANRDQAVKELAEQLFYPLWDAGFSVGHAVRSVRECGAQAAQRLDVATAMLDARLLAGDEGLFVAMHDLVTGAARKDAAGFLTKLKAGVRERGEQFGSVSHLLEPDVKEGSGGLRDIHTLSWGAAAVTPGPPGLLGLEEMTVLRRTERAALEEAEDFFMRLRSALHLETGKKTDRIHVDHQPWLAEALGFEDEPSLRAMDALMRATFEHGRRVEHVRDTVFDRLSHRGDPPSTEVHDETPEGVLRVFADVASGKHVSAETLDRVERVELPDDIAWTPPMRELFLSILRAGARGVSVLESMDLAGVLVRLLPEWGDVRCRPQRDPFHRYTVDVHLLQALVEMVRLLDGEDDSGDRLAVELRPAVRDRDALLLGALLHDIGKVGLGEHVAMGGTVAAAVMDRIGIEEGSTRDLVLFLVDQHLLLSDTATRRDLVAARIGDPERLASLYLLSIADGLATGPHAWTPWRATLIRDLVWKVRHVLERGDMGAETAERLAERTDVIRRLLQGEDPGAVEWFLRQMPRSYLLGVLPERAIRHFHLVHPTPGAFDMRTQAEPGDRPGTYGLTVVAHDRPGLLAKIAGALALSGLSILSAQVFTTEDGVAVDLFEVEGAFEEEIDEERWRRFRSTLRKGLEGRIALDYRVKEKRSHYPSEHADVPVEVTVDNEASDFSTVIEVGGPDRIGFLFDLTSALFEMQLDVHVAKVATYGGRVVDALYVRDAVGRKIEDAEHIDEIRRAITARIS